MNDYEENNFSDCPYCNERYPWCQPTVPGRSLVLGYEGPREIVRCLNPECTGEVLLGDDSCPQCGIGFTKDDWEYYHSESQSYSVPSRNNSLVDLARDHLEEPDMLCCAAPADVCTCDEPVPWEDVFELSNEVWDDLYAGGEDIEGCSSCSHWYRGTCLPLRAVLHKILIDGEIPGQIDHCSYYEMSEAFVEINARESVTPQDGHRVPAGYDDYYGDSF